MTKNHVKRAHFISFLFFLNRVLTHVTLTFGIGVPKSWLRVHHTLWRPSEDEGIV